MQQKKQSIKNGRNINWFNLMRWPEKPTSVGHKDAKMSGKPRENVKKFYENN